MKPLFCIKCQEYTHTEKRCRNSERCRLCAGPHKSTECKEKVPKCYHCGEEHSPGSRNCPKQIQEEEICSIQHKEKVSWNVARQKYLARSDESTRKTYAQMVKSSKQQEEGRKADRSIGYKRQRTEEGASDPTHKKGRTDALDDEVMSDESDGVETIAKIAEEARKICEMITTEGTHDDIINEGSSSAVAIKSSKQ